MTELVKQVTAEEITPATENTEPVLKKVVAKKQPILSSAVAEPVIQKQADPLMQDATQKDLTVYPAKKTTIEQQQVVRDEKKYARDRDREKVKGVFRYHEVPGGMFSFVMKKHKGDPIERYDLIDGQTYELPRGVALHLANDVWFPVHQYMKTEEGKPHQAIGKKVKRVEFYPADFLALDQLSGNSIVSVHYL